MSLQKRKRENDQLISEKNRLETKCAKLENEVNWKKDIIVSLEVGITFVDPYLCIVGHLMVISFIDTLI